MNAPAAIKAPNVYQRLNAARIAFHSAKLTKTGENKFAGYKYFELADFAVPATRIFAEHGLCAIVSFTADTATMRIINADDPADCTEVTSPMGSASLKGCHEVQNIGAVETYQRRYLWTAALEIVEHDALDATTGRDAPQQSAFISDEQLVKLQSLIKATSSNPQAFCQRLNVQDLSTLSADRFSEALELLENKLAKMAKAQKEPA